MSGLIYIENPEPVASITGSGSASRLPLWASTFTLSNSALYQLGTLVGVNVAVPTAGLSLPPGTGGAAALNFATGVAPTTPNVGDVWFDGTDLRARNGVGTQTVAYVGGPGVGTVTGTGTAGAIPRWIGTTPATALGDSLLSQSGTLVTNSGTFLADNGSQAAPAYSFTSSPGTGMFCASTDPFLRFAVTGTYRVVVTSFGEVGINTNTPREMLHVSGGSVKVGANANDSFLSFGDESTTVRNVGVYRGAGATALSLGGYGGITFHASATTLGSQAEQMRITGTGDVGIGTPSPTARLHVGIGSVSSGTLAQLMVGYGGGSANYFDANTQIFRSGSAVEVARITASRLDVTGDVNFTNALYLSSTKHWTEKSTATNGMTVLSSALRTLGRKLYPDECFSYGVNGIAVYDNNGSGQLTITRVSSSGLAVPNNSGFVLQATHTGTGPTPGYGGFYFGAMTRANATLVCVFRAKIPLGYSLSFATNAIGDNGDNYWATLSGGTGSWQDYVYVVKCGAGGTFSSTLFFYLTGSPAPSAGSPITWYISSATVFDEDDKVTYAACANAGTTNYLSKWTSAAGLGTSLVYDNGTAVGVGTVSPATRLHVVDTTNEQVRIDATGPGYLFLGYNQANNYARIGAYDSALPGFRALLLNEAGGNVGIGTTNPVERLTVATGSGNDRFGLSIVGAVTTAYWGSSLATEDVRTSEFDRATGFWHFKYGTTGAALTTALLIDSTGNVGIGTAGAPVYALGVYRALTCNVVATSSSTTHLASLAAFNDAGTGAQIRMFAYGDAYSGTVAGVPLAGLTRLYAQGTAGLLIHNDSSGPLRFARASAEIARFSGDVLAVGSTVTSDASRFIVRGNAAVDEVIARVDNGNATVTTQGYRSIIEVAGLNYQGTYTRLRLQAKGGGNSILDNVAVEIGTPDAVPLYMYNGGTVRMVLDSTVTVTAPMAFSAGNNLTLVDSNLVIGTPGKGIDFSATAGAGTSEILDDYEEGDWSPVLVSTSGTVTTNSAASVGRYTKVGRLVSVHFYCAVTSVSAPGGNLYINNLPFTAAAAGYGQYGTSGFIEMYRGSASGSTYAHTVGTLFNSATNITCYWYSTDRGWNTSVAAFLNGSANTVTGYLTYTTDA